MLAPDAPVVEAVDAGVLLAAGNDEEGADDGWEEEGWRDEEVDGDEGG